MKRYSELSTEEFIKLNDNEIEQLIKLECAYEGVILSPMPEEPTYEEEPNADGPIAYKLSDISNIVVKDKNILVDLIEFLEVNRPMLYSIDNMHIGDKSFNIVTDLKRHNWGNERMEFDIKRISTYDIKTVDSYKEKIRSNQTLTDKYKEDIKKWKEGRNGFDSIVREVHDAYNNAISINENKCDKLNQFKEYLDLADGDEDIAWTFFNKAYPNIEDNVIEYIKENIKTGE